jgi:hypothetical protein
MGAERLRAIVISAAMAALALVLPVVFHATGLGSKFLPMLLPLLLNGFLVPFRWAVGTGLAVPLISALAMGMPPLYPPAAFVLAVEGALLGGVASALYRRGRGSAWPPLVAAIAVGRLSTFALTWAAAQALGLPAVVSASAMIVQGLPGVALQLVVVPLALRGLGRPDGILFSDGR